MSDKLWAELNAFVRVALDRDVVRRKACYVIEWQDRLRTLCERVRFPCRIWRECVYELDVRLQVEVEGFVLAVLSARRVSRHLLPVLAAWQRRLRDRCAHFVFPRRLWGEFVYRLNLQVEE